MAVSYEISPEAEEDWYNIIAYTLENFGERQVQKYTTQINKCVDDLINLKLPIKELDVSGHTVFVKHCQMHYIFAQKRNNEKYLILAIFHERMDLMELLKNRLS